ncbi:MAG TPA: elongation factor G [bacterium]|nr:elongation factor G [bacterium]
MGVIRSVGLIAPKGTGKTSLAEAILFNAKVIKRLGRVEDGNTAMDFDQEEIDRGMTLMPSVFSFDLKGAKIHMIDTAGYPDFINETRMMTGIFDNAIFVLNGAEGVKSQSLKLWKMLNDRGMPRMIFISSMDKELADYGSVLDSISNVFGMPAAPVTMPVTKDKKLVGVVDLAKMKYYADKGGGAVEESDIPADLADEAAEYREKLVESAAEQSDELMEKYLDSGELSPDEVEKGLRGGAAAGKICPVFAGSSTLNIGVSNLMSYLAELTAGPESAANFEAKDTDGNPVTVAVSPKEQFAGIVFKTMVDQYAGKISVFKVLTGTLKPETPITLPRVNRKARVGNLFLVNGKTQTPTDKAEPGDIVCVVKVDDLLTGETLCDPARPIIFELPAIPEPVIALAVVPKERGEEDKLSRGLGSILEEDPLLKTRRDEQTKQLTVCGSGQIHLDSVVSRLRRRFQVNVDVAPPEIPYRETVTKSAKYVEYTHKKQTGGAGQFARVFIDLEPVARGEGYEFADKIFGGVIDQNFRPSVDKGVRAKMAEGILAGYPVVDVRVSLVDGKTHPVDSKDIAFQVAGREVFKKAAMMCNPILLEPVMSVEIEAPDECMGDVIGDINSRRGRVNSTEQAAGATIIKAQVPLAEMLRYAPDLDAMTSGRGTYTMELGHYEEVPKRVADEIVAKYNKQRQDAE